MNPGGWLLLTLIFSGLLLIVQRAERKRRLVTLFIMILVGVTVWNYALYRMGRGCDVAWQVLCSFSIVQQRLAGGGALTAGLAFVSALVINFLYWALFGRYNPVGSSDSIEVIGRYD